MSNKFIYWSPRVLLILFILFLALFSLDVFDGAAGFRQTALALFMHNLPSLILTVILIIAWKYEMVGAYIFIIFGLLCAFEAFILAPKLPNGITNPIFYIGTVVFLLIGILFWLSYRQKKLP